MPTFRDQINKEIILSEIPKRIISLVPSQTELLFDLGLKEEVIGITKFCVHPEQWFRSKTRIGGTKNVNIELIKTLQPDLIIANKEENVKEQIEELEKIAPVWISDIRNTEEAIDMIRSIGNITGKEEAATRLLNTIKNNFEELRLFIHSNQQKIKTAYLIWKEPYMAAGGNTFIDSLLQLSGLENVFSNTDRYPKITTEDLRSKDTELVLLSSEPYPFQQKHIEELKAQLPNAQIMLADGEMFSWYGSRMQFAPAYICQLLKQLKQ